MFEIVDLTVVGTVIAAGIFLAILVCLMLGRWLGRRAIARYGAAGVPNISSLEAAVFALLGLLIAFTFSGALSRFDVRRNQAVEEANAIGTAYLRIDLLSAHAQPLLRETFRKYVDARIETYRALPDLKAARLELARSQDLQREIWTQAVAAARVPESRPDAELLVMPALNQMAKEKFSVLQPFVDRLKKDPNDAEANLKLGEYFGLFKGKWDRALPYLASKSRGSRASLTVTPARATWWQW